MKELSYTPHGWGSQKEHWAKEARHKRCILYDIMHIKFKNRQKSSTVKSQNNGYIPGEEEVVTKKGVREASGILVMFYFLIWVAHFLKLVKLYTGFMDFLKVCYMSIKSLL